MAPSSACSTSANAARSRALPVGESLDWASVLSLEPVGEPALARRVVVLVGAGEAGHQFRLAVRGLGGAPGG